MKASARENDEVEHWRDKKNGLGHHKYRPKYQNVVIPWVLEFYHRKNPSSKESKIPLAIDLDCGFGRLTRKLAPSCDRVIGVDSSIKMLAVAKKYFVPANTEYRHGSALDLSRVCCGEKADIITVGEAIPFGNSSFFTEVKKCLKSNGVFAVFTYHPVGVDIEGLDNIFAQYLSEQCAHIPLMMTYQSLRQQFKDLKFPFDSREYYERRVKYRVTRDMMKSFFMSVLNILKDGVEGIERLVEILPAEDSFNFLCDVYGMVATKF